MQIRASYCERTERGLNQWCICGGVLLLLNNGENVFSHLMSYTDINV